MVQDECSFEGSRVRVTEGSGGGYLLSDEEPKPIVALVDEVGKKTFCPVDDDSDKNEKSPVADDDTAKDLGNVFLKEADLEGLDTVKVCACFEPDRVVQSVLLICDICDRNKVFSLGCI